MKTRKRKSANKMTGRNFESGPSPQPLSRRARGSKSFSPRWTGSQSAAGAGIRRSGREKGGDEGIALHLKAASKSFARHPVVREVTLDIRQGEFFSLLGPSGCGKTTLLRMIAGFEQPDAGEIVFPQAPPDGKPAYARDVNLVFQHYALFPHMTVEKNIAFGLEMASIPASDRSRRVEEALALVRLEGLGKRLPRELSGGQQQRVALARAIVTHPSMLLLDEPLGALDLKLRREMQVELKNLQRRLGITFIYVTHDQEEALSMSDRLAVMHHGRVLQVGTPDELYERPATRFVASFIGETNFFEARVDRVRADYAMVSVDGVGMKVAAFDEAAEGLVWLFGIRPERIALARRRAAARANQFEAQIEESVYLGTDVQYRIRVGASLLLTVREQNAGHSLFKTGERVYASWPPDAVQLIASDPQD
jgi:spermidine/putrescine transport system ATP-binding protein